MTTKGPSGFIELNGQLLVVDFGKIFLDGAIVGLIFDDGYLQHTSGPFGTNKNLRPIDAIPGCVFRGIDSGGLELILPQSGEANKLLGPTGNLKFNAVPFHVINGRIAAPDHGFVGEFDDEGKIFVRDYATRVAKRELDEHSCLNFSFEGKKSNGEPLNTEWTRKLSRRDKPYSEDETIRYFMDYDQLKGQEKKYLFDNMKLWAVSGILQTVRRNEGNCALGNVRHGAAGQTGVRTGNVTLDRDEMGRDLDMFYKHGPFAVVYTRYQPYLEVRINLVVAHEFGHQLEFILSKATQDEIFDLYEKMLRQCDKQHPLPDEYPGASELLKQHEVSKRIFISGYARFSSHEYFAESVAAFSIEESRRYLKEHDPRLYQIIESLFYEPEKVIRPVLKDQLHSLQASLRMGKEMPSKPV